MKSAILMTTDQSHVSSVNENQNNFRTKLQASSAVRQQGLNQSYGFRSSQSRSLHDQQSTNRRPQLFTTDQSLAWKLIAPLLLRECNTHGVLNSIHLTGMN